VDLALFIGGPLDGQTHSLDGEVSEELRMADPRPPSWFKRRHKPQPSARERAGALLYRRRDDGAYEFVEEG
jgi:hypothetical protein